MKFFVITLALLISANTMADATDKNGNFQTLKNLGSIDAPVCIISFDDTSKPMMVQIFEKCKSDEGKVLAATATGLSTAAIQMNVIREMRSEYGGYNHTATIVNSNGGIEMTFVKPLNN